MLITPRALVERIQEEFGMERAFEYYNALDAIHDKAWRMYTDDPWGAVAYARAAYKHAWKALCRNEPLIV